jgi:AraC-like DNA-binding protein
MRIVQEGYAAPEPGRTGWFQHRVIETIKRHVAEMAGRDVSLAEAARLAGYSKFHFLRLFKQETGMTFHDYVNECRRKTAAALLREGRHQDSRFPSPGLLPPLKFPAVDEGATDTANRTTSTVKICRASGPGVKPHFNSDGVNLCLRCTSTLPPG